jgi:copper chaperone CopZ
MKTTLEIQNLKCGGCGHTISTKLAELDHIEDIVVTPEEDTVSFEYQDQINLDEAVALLSKLGYPVSGAPNSLSKKAKSYVSCAIGRLNN